MASQLNVDLSAYHFPIVFKNEKLRQWPCFKWSINDWITKCRRIKFPFRIHSIEKNQKVVQWENEAVAYLEATLDQFVEWQNLESVSENNPFYKFPKSEFWSYSSYNYMKDIFKTEQEVLQSVKWSDLKLSNDLADPDGRRTTFWIGTKYAYTPCHYDTYDYNIVAQIKGKKLWILFPEDDAKFLYPTRIPYEESSIFSSVNILNPNFIEHDQFKNSHPYIVLLEPGDLLLVPHHWWHFVYCIDDDNGCCISVNLWQPIDRQYHSITCESMISLLTSALFSHFESESVNWINDKHKHQLCTPEEAMKYIIVWAEKCAQENNGDVYEKNCVPENIELPKNAIYVSEKTLEDINQIFKWKSTLTSEMTSSQIAAKDVIDCILHPEVITLIVNKLVSTQKRKGCK
ncbi:HSPB1-associated protein 1-like protein [Dinothrombium tinctorium]|uniref:HSPB1-associated protein 1-like protein n=1 Tax=Dinothrombium tinctorium TaxID=1965070 RepID=A0A443RL33_9ACAR|nr:HSPB1-associated protein 1-like protein [Dinothrombium tinctorium]